MCRGVVWVLCLDAQRGACTARDAALRTGLARRRQTPDAAITGGEGPPATRWIETVIVVRAPRDGAPSVPAHLRGVFSQLFKLRRQHNQEERSNVLKT